MIRERTHGAERRLPYSDRSGKDYFLPGRSAIMIDGSGIHYALRALNADIDYRRLRGLFVDYMRLVRALYYVLTMREEDVGVRRLLDWLEYNGYEVREKLGRGFVDANWSSHSPAATIAGDSYRCSRIGSRMTANRPVQPRRSGRCSTARRGSVRRSGRVARSYRSRWCSIYFV